MARTNQRYDGVGNVVLRESNVEIRRRLQVRAPWDNWLQHVYVDGEVDRDGEVRKDPNGELYLFRFHGALNVPALRRTSLVAQSSSIEGDHPLGNIQVSGGETDLRSPDYSEGIPRSARYALNSATDLGIIGAVSGTAYALSRVASGLLGAGWGLDTSLLVGAGANVGIRERNAGSLITSLLLAGGIIFGPEILNNAPLDGEDVLRMAELVASGFLGKGIRRVYDRILE